MNRGQDSEERPVDALNVWHQVGPPIAAKCDGPDGVAGEVIQPLDGLCSEWLAVVSECQGAEGFTQAGCLLYVTLRHGVAAPQQTALDEPGPQPFRITDFIDRIFEIDRVDEVLDEVERRRRALAATRLPWA
jgi:hypothetical protein